MTALLLALCSLVSTADGLDVMPLAESACSVCEGCSWDWAVRDAACGPAPVVTFSFVRTDGECYMPSGCGGDVPCCTSYALGCAEEACTTVWACPNPWPGEMVMIAWSPP